MVCVHARAWACACVCWEQVEGELQDGEGQVESSRECEAPHIETVIYDLKVRNPWTAHRQFHSLRAHVHGRGHRGKAVWVALRMK